MKEQGEGEERNLKMNYKNYDELPLMLSVEDVEKVLGLSRINAYNICHSEGFPAKRVGKRILVPKDSFIEWLHK